MPSTANPALCVLRKRRRCLPRGAALGDFPPQRTAGACFTGRRQLPGKMYESGRAIMHENQESKSNGHNQSHNQNGLATVRADANRWLVVAVVALFGIAAVAFAYGLHQQSMVRELSAQSAIANAALNQMQGQLNAATAKLNDMTATRNSPPTPTASTPPPDATISEPSVDSAATTPESASTSTPATTAKSAPAKRHIAKRRTPVVDKKYLQLESQLAEQQKQLKET